MRNLIKLGEYLPILRSGKRVLRDIFGSDPAPAPDYTPMANASKEAAEIGKQLGEEQIAESKRQYDQNMAVAKPIIDLQAEQMRQTNAQGNDYYNYMVANQRPLESKMNQFAMNGSEATDAASRGAVNNAYASWVNGLSPYSQGIQGRYAQNDAQNQRDMGLINGSAADIYNARQGDIDWGVNNAVADARNGQSQQYNTMIRQGLRYGWSPDKLATAAVSLGMGNASQQAAAANQARTAGITDARNLMQNQYNMRNANDMQAVQGLTAGYNMANTAGQLGVQNAQNARAMQQQDTSTNWARMLDVDSMYRGLPGASQGAYSLSNNSGNSAVANQMAPGNSYMAGLNAGSATQMQGLGQQIQGLGSLLGAQTNAYNASLQSNASSAAGLGSLLGNGAMFAKTMKWV